MEKQRDIISSILLLTYINILTFKNMNLFKNIDELDNSSLNLETVIKMVLDKITKKG